MATLVAAIGAPRALMYRTGHTGAAAAARYQHVLDGQDIDIAIAEYRDDLVTKGTQGARTE
ncbi:MAG: hypothetical protein JWO37_281 [Acidimicrobiales bacterium]|nr:hypothetical protein [Acidimicrobiales bacterium]